MGNIIKRELTLCHHRRQIQRMYSNLLSGMIPWRQDRYEKTLGKLLMSCNTN